MNKPLYLFIFAIMLVGVQGALSDNLTAYYSFDTNCSIADVGGNTAIAGSQVTSTTGKLSNGCTFSGSGTLSTNAIILPANFSNNVDNLTLCYWTKYDTEATGFNIFSKSSATFRAQYSIGNDDFYFIISGEASAYGNYNLAWTNWHHNCVGTNSSHTFMYVDGNFTQLTATTSNSPASGDLYFGSNGVNNNELYDGIIDEIGWWNRTLNSTEIAELYNSGSGCALSGCINPLNVTNFTITLSDIYNSSAIQTFNATINGTLYQTTTGTISTPYQSNNTQIVNITLSALNYFSNTTLNYNTSTNLAGTITPYTLITSINHYNGSSLLSFAINYTNNANSSETGVLSTTNGNIYTPLYNATYTVTFYNVTNYFNNTNTSVSATPYFLRNYTINATPYTQIYAKDIINSTSITHFTINYTNNANSSENGTVTTTNGVANVPFYNANYTTHIYDSHIGTQYYTTNNATLNATTPYLQNYTFYLYRTNTVNITFYHERNLSIASNVNIAFSLIIEDVFSANYTTSNGTYYLENLGAGDYEIRYSGTVTNSSTFYPERSYFFTLTNYTYNALSLYIADANNVQEVTNTLYDDLGNKLQGYYIKLLRYYVSSNSYLMVDECRTNFVGECVLNIEISDENTSVYYKFRIVGEDGTVYKTTDATKVYDTSLTHFITLSQSITESLIELNGVSYNLSFLSASNQFKFTWDDSAGLVPYGQLKIYTVTGNGTESLYNSTTTSSSSGTIYLSVLDDNTSTYVAKAYTGTTKVDQKTKSFFTSFETFGILGIFATVIIIITIIFIGLNNPAVAVMMVPVALVITKLSSFNPIAWSSISIIFALSLIIAYAISKVT